MRTGRMNDPTQHMDSINMDFSRRVVVHTAQMEWLASPAQGVWRKPLAREFAEHGHATSIVRYDAGARFASHEHPGGEEILVLDGVFSDADGDYGRGTYIRNPPGTRHAPFSESGCTILVKLHQFAPGDDTQLRIDTQAEPWLPCHGDVETQPLHKFGSERVCLVFWPAGASLPRKRFEGGEELYVIRGTLEDEHGQYPAGTWVRTATHQPHTPRAKIDTLVWMKVGHFPQGL